jgi:hypothetical protein
VIRSLVPALALAALSAVAGYSLSERADAQSAPAAQVQNTQAADVSAASRPDRPQRPRMRGRQQSDYCRMADSRTWGLFFPQTDKRLSVGDVSTIADAILLRRGDHSWKVADLVKNQDDTISFSFTTQGGETIARFSMDVHTGRLRRLA